MTIQLKHRTTRTENINAQEPDKAHSPNQFRWGRRVYAIAFDIDTDALQNVYGGESWRGAYEQIERIFTRHGFHRQQGSVYFGNESVDPVRCVLAVQECSRTLTWFRFAIKDIRMLRIEENNDLMPAVEKQAPLPLAPAPAPAE